jgi:DNA-3-methyladenine glycosylase II
MAGLIGAVGPQRIAALGGLVSLEHHCPYESLARAIAHQQLNGKAAQSILARLLALFGQSFPTPAQLLAASPESLRAAGFSYSKIAALKDLAARTLEGVVPEAAALEPLSDLAIIERLTSVRGIGRWTVQMMLIFQLGRPDVLPVEDFGVCNGFRLAYGLSGMPQPRALAAFGERWKPHRSLAAWYLWRAVELERSGTLPRCARRPRIAIRKLAGKLAPVTSRARRKLRPSTRAAARPARQSDPGRQSRPGRPAPRGASAERRS